MKAIELCSHRISIITGHYGTGKTEFSVNLALAMAAEGETVMLADLDIVNPYFRSRERKPMLEAAGVRLISSSQACSDADVPSLPAELLAGKTLTRVALDGTETEVAFEIDGEEASFTLDFTADEIPVILIRLTDAA